MIRKVIRSLLAGLSAWQALSPRNLTGSVVAVALALAGLIGGGVTIVDRITASGAKNGSPGIFSSWWKGKRTAEAPLWREGDGDEEDDDGGAASRGHRRKVTLGSPASPEDIASIGRSGMVFRDGKWLPASLAPRPGPHGKTSSGGGGGQNAVVQLFVTTGSLPEATINKPYSAQIQATGGTPPYSWSLSGTLPQGLRLNFASGALSGTPQQLFSDSVRVRVRDAAGAADEAEFLLVVLPEDPLRITTETLATAYPGTAFSAPLEAAGGVVPYGWSVQGQLPPGLTCSTGGLISGTPTGELKKFSITVAVTDAQGTQVSKPLTLEVGTPALHITTASELTPVHQGKPVETALDADGGTPPYQWQLVAGELPPGMTFVDGVFTGTPETIGKFGPLSVSVSDTTTPQAQITQGDFYIEVTEAPIGPVTDLEIHPSLRKAVLTWHNPIDPGFSETLVVRSTGGVPANPDEGDIVYQGPDQTAIDDGLAEGVTYHYAAFAFNADGEFSALEETSYNSAPILPFTPARAGAGRADPHADNALFTPLSGATRNNSSRLPDIVLGPPQGGGLAAGSSDVVSLGAAVSGNGAAPYGGEIVVQFTDNVIVDGPGVDFTVFENAFYTRRDDGSLDPDSRFMEPAVVSVSQDGVNWRRFPFDFSPRYDPVTGALNLRNPFCYNYGFAGVNPVAANADPTIPAESGGDSFDLASVGLTWARFVKIQSTGDNWMTDRNGDLVRHTAETLASIRFVPTSGFDLDAVTAVNY